jgi:hypothetical protein
LFIVCITHFLEEDVARSTDLFDVVVPSLPEPC